MANTKKFAVKNGLQTQNVDFVSPNEANTITITMLDSDTLSVSGNSGQLFSITDSLTGTIFAVNDISGVPSIEVEDTGEIRLAETFGNVLIGTATDTGEKLQVVGNASVTGNMTAGGNVTVAGNITTGGQFIGNGAGLTNLNASNLASGTIPNARLSGTYTGVNITGNAATATTLQTARTINGTSFNGSADITTANWGTARTLTIGNTGKSVNGSANVSWSLAEIGAPDTNGTGATGTWGISISGNAATATTVTGTQLGNATHALTDFADAAAWSKPAGYQTMIRVSGSNAAGFPSGHGQSFFGYTVTSRRDTGGGYSALLTSYDNSNLYFTYNTTNSAYPVWRRVLHDANFNSFAPTLTGTGASGTWGISITGNAATVTNGVYTTGSYSNPTWITALDAAKISSAPVTKTSNFTVSNTDYWIICNGSSAITVTLPTPSANTGRALNFKNIANQAVNSASSNVVSLYSASTQSVILPATAGSWATLVSDGTNWVIMQASSDYVV